MTRTHGLDFIVSAVDVSVQGNIQVCPSAMRLEGRPLQLDAQMEEIVKTFGELALLNAVPGLTWGYVRKEKPPIELTAFEADQEEFLREARKTPASALQEKYEMTAREMISMAEDNFDVEAREDPMVMEYLEKQRAAAEFSRFLGWEETEKRLSQAWRAVQNDSPVERLLFACDHSASVQLACLVGAGVQALVDAGASKVLLGEALLLATQAEDIDTVKTLLSHDTDLLNYIRQPECATTRSDYQAIHFAADTGNVDLLGVIIEFTKAASMMNAALDARVFSRKPIASGGRVGVLHLAANSGNLECIQMLLKECSAEQMSAAERFGLTALDIVICNACTFQVDDEYVIQLTTAFTGRGCALPDAEATLEEAGLEMEPRAEAVISLVSTLASQSK